MVRTVASFGEILLRMSPTGAQTLRSSPALAVHTGGAEANVAVALAQLGHRARMISVVPDNPLGERARRALRRRGADTRHVATGPGRMGLYFYTPSAGARRAGLFYDRTGSAFALRRCEEWDFAEALASVDHLHLSGIAPALGEEPAKAALAAARAARERGATVSIDGNYRAQLWEERGADPRDLLGELVGLADLLFGNHRDAALLLGRDFPGEGPARRRAAAEALLEAFPRLALVASTAREIVAADTHRLTGRIDTRESVIASEAWTIEGVLDRIGSGDAFAAGVLHGRLTAHDNLANALELGMRMAALKHATPGDFIDVELGELDSVTRQTGDVIR